MTLKSIKVGKWYMTTGGAIGKCKQAGGCFPPGVMLDVTYPMPMGTKWFTPREISSEVPDPTTVKK